MLFGNPSKSLDLCENVKSEHCFLCFWLLWLSVWIVHFSGQGQYLPFPYSYLFVDYSGLTNNPLGKWESEKEQEEEHNYEYVDENVIENIRKVFQDTTTRNKDILSEDRRWVSLMIIYGCKQMHSEWFSDLPVAIILHNEETFSMGATTIATYIL